MIVVLRYSIQRSGHDGLRVLAGLYADGFKHPGFSFDAEGFAIGKYDGTFPSEGVP
jgi:hypothetical protein